MPSLHDEYGNRIGYIGGDGVGCGSILGLGLVIFVVGKTVAFLAPIWIAFANRGVHPVFIIVLFALAGCALLFTIGFLAGFAAVRGFAAGALCLPIGYSIFTSVMKASDYIWAGGALALFCFFAYRFVRWAVDADDSFSSIFFL